MNKAPKPENTGSHGKQDDAEELRLRLAEAEETIRAIRSGLVDALVISGPGGDQVFTLRGADQPYRVILQTMFEGALTMARDGTILFCNQRLAELLSTPMERIIGTSVLTHVTQDSVGAMTAFLYQTSSSSARRELNLMKADGSAFPVSMSAAPLISDGLQAISAVVMDLTERKQAEHALRVAYENLEQRVEERTVELQEANRQLAAEIAERILIEEALRQSERDLQRYGQELESLVQERTEQIQKLERQRREYEKLAAVGRMAARVAHEINNPLAGVKGSFVLIKRAIPVDHPHYEFAARIEKEIDRIARIVRQMFEIYKPAPQEPRMIRPAAVIQDVVMLLEGNCHTQAIVLEFDAEGAATPVVLHEDSLRQILFSIIQNAIEASPTGGQVHVTATQEDARLSIQVADQGGGIPPEVGSQIFEPFYTTKSELTGAGLGLGLAITKGLVEAAGGSISFQSDHQGTTFYVTLPVVPVSQEKETA